MAWVKMNGGKGKMSFFDRAYTKGSSYKDSMNHHFSATTEITLPAGKYFLVINGIGSATNMYYTEGSQELIVTNAILQGETKYLVHVGGIYMNGYSEVDLTETTTVTVTYKFDTYPTYEGEIGAEIIAFKIG